MKTLQLKDLKPKEAEFELSGKPGVKITLKKFTLRERIWMNERFTRTEIKTIFENKMIKELAEVAFHLIKDKSQFPAFEDFLDAVEDLQDQVNLIQAVLKTTGIDEEILQELSKSAEQSPPNVGAPKE